MITSCTNAHNARLTVISPKKNRNEVTHTYSFGTGAFANKLIEWQTLKA